MSLSLSPVKYLQMIFHSLALIQVEWLSVTGKSMYIVHTKYRLALEESILKQCERIHGD